MSEPTPEPTPLIYEVEKLLLMGKPLDLIIDGLAQGDPDAKPPRLPVPPEETRTAHVEVLRRWCEDAGSSDLRFARQLRTLRHLYDRSYKLNDFKTCVSITVEIEKLQAKQRDKEPQPIGTLPAAPSAAGPQAPKRKPRKLNPKQQAFAREYVVDHNATQAAIRAGYSVNGAGQTGFNLLKIPEIQYLVQEYEREAEARAEVSKDWIMRGLKAEAKGAEQPGPRVRAFELLGKEIGMFKNQLEVTGKDGGPVQVEDAREVLLGKLLR